MKDLLTGKVIVNNFYHNLTENENFSQKILDFEFCARLHKTEIV